MPGIVAHMAVAKLVGDSLQLNSNAFFRGNILPDILNGDSNVTHHKIQGKLYLVPDLNYWKNTLDLSEEEQLGYFVHLLLDWHFLEEYVPIKVKNKNAFIDRSMYSDYDNLNSKLIERFNLNRERIKQILDISKEDIDSKKLLYNQSCLENEKEGETENLDEEDFSSFLFNIAKTISKEVLVYAGESSKLSICPRQYKKRKHKKK